MELTDKDLQSIREKAYFKWLDAGAPCCDGVDYWLNAEFEYLHDMDRDGPSPAASQTTRSRSRPHQTAGRANPSLPEKEAVIGSRG
jgi:hypothetical protein